MNKIIEKFKKEKYNNKVIKIGNYIKEKNGNVYHCPIINKEISISSRMDRILILQIKYYLKNKKLKLINSKTLDIDGIINRGWGTYYFKLRFRTKTFLGNIKTLGENNAN